MGTLYGIVFFATGLLCIGLPLAALAQKRGWCSLWHGGVLGLIGGGLFGFFMSVSLALPTIKQSVAGSAILMCVGGLIGVIAIYLAKRRTG